MNPLFPWLPAGHESFHALLSSSSGFFEALLNLPDEPPEAVEGLDATGNPLAVEASSTLETPRDVARKTRKRTRADQPGSSTATKKKRAADANTKGGKSARERRGDGDARRVGRAEPTSARHDQEEEADGDEDEDEPRFVLNPAIIKLFADSEKRRAQAKEELLILEEQNRDRERASLQAQKVETKRLRTLREDELRVLFGPLNYEKIKETERDLETAFDMFCTRTRPKLWPSMPFSASST